MPLKRAKAHTSIYIAAIGSSAGGLEAMQQLLSNLPDELEHIAFVIVQHLSPSYKSMLGETLKRFSQLNIVDVKNNLSIIENIIYITPPGYEIKIRDNKFHLSKPARTTAARPSIDNLCISLAADYGEKAIGIILSGTGSDGAKGIKAIKDAGGATIVQDPASAKYNSMPLAAIETGKADYILKPAKIGATLKKITTLQTKQPGTRRGAIKDTGFEKIIAWLSKSTGTDFTNYKLNTLFRRITKRMDQLKIDSTAGYLKYIEKNEAEADELFYTTLIGFTGFFRDTAVFKTLQKALSSIISNKPGHESIRVWVAGCATGEEAYSMAISLALLQKENKVQHPVQIFATDINDHSLTVARKGIYDKKAVQNIPAPILKDYFTLLNGHYQVQKSIRSMVLFSRHDLTNNPPFLKLDLLVCRNLLIYFNSKLQQHIFPVFHSALAPNGFLLLGKSESIGQFSNLFSTVSNVAKIYQRKAVSFLPRIHYKLLKPAEKNIVANDTERSIAEMVKETIYRTFEWPFVVVNDQMEVMEIHGDVAKYLALSPGQMNANLVKLAHKDIKIELRLLVHKCINNKKETKGLVKKLTYHDQKELEVKITVRPLSHSQKPNDYYIVIFEQVKVAGHQQQQKFIPSGKNDARKIALLERELDSVKMELQGYIDRLENTYAALQSTNQELQGANEELKISNEELETANEELQSSNEEINIAYTELKTANEALEIRDAALYKSEANVNALLNNTLQAFILLDANYQVLALNNVAHNTFKNIFGKDIEAGDNFKHLISKELSGHFKEEIKEALTGKTVVKEKKIETREGKTFGFVLNCTPVLDESKKVQALSVGFLDITVLKKTQEELLKARQLLDSVFHTADIGIAVIDENGKYFKTNEGYNRLFGYKSNELDGKPYTVTVPAQYRKDMKDQFPEYFNGKKASEERVAIKKKGELISVYRTIDLLVDHNSNKYLVLTARDISETKKYRKLLQSTEKMAQIGGWELDVATGKRTYTDSLSSILEVEPTDLRRMSIEKRLSHSYNNPTGVHLRQALKEAINNGKPFDLELQVNTANHLRKWVRAICVPECVAGKVIRLIGTTQDITFRKEAQLKVERLSMVASNTNNAVFITDKYGKTEWINEAVTKMTGYKLPELLHKAPGEILQGADTDKATIARISKQLKRKLPVSEIIKNYRKDGTEFWINMNIAPVFDNNELVNFIGVGADITDFMKAKEAGRILEVLEQQRDLFNAIASNFPDGIIGVLDQHFNYVFVGGSEIGKMGFTREHFIGNKIFDHISEASNLLALPYLQRALKGEHTSFEVEMKGNYYIVNAVPLIDRDRKITKVLVILYNITVSKNAETELRETLRKEKELGNLKSRFVTMASHEFRTPLSTVLSSAYLIDKYKTTDDQPLREKHLHRIVSSVEMLTDILNDFLSLGKIEEGKIQVKPAKFNLPEMIQALASEIKNNLKKDQKIQYSHEGNIEVFTDTSLLKHIIMNLVSNASKFSPEKAAIEIRTNCSNGQMILSVKDQGIGISAEDQRHLAERFFRASNATNIQGTGLGLHIVSKYIELMDGTMQCKSELEKGTEFIITFKTNTSRDEKNIADRR